MRTNAILILLTALAAPTGALAAPFSECPIEAFLIQDRYAQAYGVNLGTGYYQLLASEMGTDNKLNAAGFNYHDAYLYAWSSEHGAPVRIGDDYQVEPLVASGLPAIGFYVGDVSIQENAYFIYRPGSSYGLYRIPLEGPNALEAIQIVDGSALDLQIFDFAFHPDNNFLYAVDNIGTLWRIAPTTGDATSLGNIGESGTFGAAYFDVTGKLYISRNQDGKIYRIDPTADDVAAELFALGPASSNNDGARCALAPVVSAENPIIDFGDAPQSYQTSFDNNGARHDQTNNNLYLGKLVDAEADAWVYPLADDHNGSADEDGIVFVTGTQVGSRAIVSMTASQAGYLNAWIDFDQNGSFDVSEQILDAYRIEAGESAASIYVPLTAKAGTTWSRFRLTSATSTVPSGGSPDGEVEDYALEISQANVIQTHYPSAIGWSTIAFEDTWPVVGDYDMNDVVVKQRTTQYRDAQDGSLVGIRIEGEVVAVGASFHNGFAVRVPGVRRDQVITSGIQFDNNYAASGSPLEAGREEAIVVVAQDLWDHIDPGENCEFYRTSQDCNGPVQLTFNVFLPIDRIFVELQPVLDPFLFATPGYYRDVADLGSPGRGLEIHLKNQEPTEAFNWSLLGQGDDASAGNYYFQNDQGMPWALEVSQAWAHPLSGIDLIQAYPQFVPFVQSQGTEETDWYSLDKAVIANTFED